MRAIRVASAALLGVASLAPTAPTAAAADGRLTQPFFTVTPSTVAPGGRVALSASGCTTTATATSGVFDAVTISPGTSTTALVDSDARLGAVYAVQFRCGSQSGRFNLTIAGGQATPTIRTPTPTIRATTVPSPLPSPVPSPLPSPGAVRGGVGGSIGGLNAGEIAAGTALVVVAATGAIYVVRRRLNNRRR
jgi:hypothetical protein